jgi:hypothetical protein
MKYTINELANSKGVSQPVREALLQMEAELDATNRQVEILSDALAESRREVAALKAVQEPVATLFGSLPVYDTTPPAAQRQWVGLTDEEIEKLRESFATRYAIEAIEAKLRSKNDPM